MTNDTKLTDLAPEKGTAMQWTRLTDTMPNHREHDRVLIYTEGSDFAGEQFFDVKAESLNENAYQDPADQPEVCRHATHWAPRPASLDQRPRGFDCSATPSATSNMAPLPNRDELLKAHYDLQRVASALRPSWQVTRHGGLEDAAKDLAHAILSIESAAAQISNALAAAEAPLHAPDGEGGRAPRAAARVHYPEEWGPSDARRLTCACGDQDPFHTDSADNGSKRG